MTDAPVVVISGQVSAGKTTAGKMLRDDDGFQYTRISKAIAKRWPATEAEKPPRSWYQEMGMHLHRTIGQRALCEETVDLIDNASQAFVIDGARWNEDIDYFRDRFGIRLIHLHLIANKAVRQTRFKKREKDVTFEEADGHEVEQEIPELADRADAVFDNSTDERERLKGFLATIIGQHHAR